MTRPLIRRAGIRSALTLGAALTLWPTGGLAQEGGSQTPPVQLSVTVTADDTRRMKDAVKTLGGSDDPFIARLSGYVTTLAERLPLREPLYLVGPLTDQEAAIIDLDSYLTSHQDAHGTIKLQVRTSWTATGLRVYTLSPASFLTLLAAIANGPMVQVPALQRQQLLFLGRMLLDVNTQAGGVIPQMAIFDALSRAFQDKHVGERLVAIVQAMADVPHSYDLVPPSRLADFRKLAEAGFFIDADPRGGGISVRYGENEYTMRPDHLMWSCLRLFSGDASRDWAEQAAARDRTMLGRDILGYLEIQVKAAIALQFKAALDAAPAGTDVALGRFRVRTLDVLLNDLPSATRTPDRSDHELISLSLPAKKTTDLRKWIEQHAGR
jgi:hypothetical protein